MKRIILAGLVGGLIVFVWSAIAHMALGLGQIGLKSLPDEARVLQTFETSLPEDGLYFFPGRDMSKATTPVEDAAWLERYRTGPGGLMVYHRRGGELNFPRLLLVEC